MWGGGCGEPACGASVHLRRRQATATMRTHPPLHRPPPPRLERVHALPPHLPVLLVRTKSPQRWPSRAHLCVPTSATRWQRPGAPHHTYVRMHTTNHMSPLPPPRQVHHRVLPPRAAGRAHRERTSPRPAREQAVLGEGPVHAPARTLGQAAAHAPSAAPACTPQRIGTAPMPAGIHCLASTHKHAAPRQLVRAQVGMFSIVALLFMIASEAMLAA